MAGNRTQSAMGGSRKKSKKKSGARVREMHVRGTANKKYVVRHDYHPNANGMTQPTDEHGISNLDELLQHVQQHGADMSPEQPSPSKQEIDSLA